MSMGICRPVIITSWFPLVRLNLETLVLFQSVQYNMLLYTTRPKGWMLFPDDSISCRFPPVRSDVSILSSLASAQKRRFVVWSIVSPFGQTRFIVTMARLAEPSISACSIFGLAPQSVQYIVLKASKNTETFCDWPRNKVRTQGARSSAKFSTSIDVRIECMPKYETFFLLGQIIDRLMADYKYLSSGVIQLGWEKNIYVLIYRRLHFPWVNQKLQHFTLFRLGVATRWKYVDK